MRKIEYMESVVKSMDHKPSPVAVFRALGDDLRLAALLLIWDQKELCVCELTEALEVPQPKMSRHLAILREVGLLQTDRRGQWVYYSVSPHLPGWLERVLYETAAHNAAVIEKPLARLQSLAGRPGVQCL